ncbi:hypothetical protein Tco_1104877 [Tanacetum coccineum]
MMANIYEDIQCVSSDTCPPILDRTDFESWQQRIRLYCLGKDNGVNILKSIDEGPFKMVRFRETLAEATKDDKDIWDNEKMLLEGSALTKDERESQLYDAFEDFRQTKGESIHEYYIRFTKLINDMRNIKMTMPKMQLNSKFVNNMLPEWDRFMTAVKLNRGLKHSIYDQLCAYLKQHEAHDNENKLMLERYNQQSIDPLALVSNVSPHQYPSQSSVLPLSTYVPPVNYQPQFVDNTQLDSGFTPTDDLIENLTKTVALLTQSYKTHLPQTNNQLRTSSNTRNQATIQNSRVVVQNVQGRQNKGQGNYARGAIAARNGGVQNRVGNANPGQARQIKCYNCNEIGYINGAVLDEEQLQFIAANQCDAFDSDVDEAPTAQTMFMANLSSTDPIYDEVGPLYDLDILSEVQDHDNYVDSIDAEYTSDSNIIPYEQYVKDNAVTVVQSKVSFVPNDSLVMIINDMHEQSAQCVSANEQSKVVNASLTAELARYKEQVKLYERWARFELNEREQKINEQLRIIITDRNIKEESLKKELHSMKMKLNSTGNGYPQKDKNKAKMGQNQARDWKERGKPKPKAYVSKWAKSSH